MAADIAARYLPRLQQRSAEFHWTGRCGRESAVGSQSGTMAIAMDLPFVTISAPDELFSSFFTPKLKRRLSSLCRWRRSKERKVTPGFRKLLRDSEALITTWDTPFLGADLAEIAPKLRIISHCGGEVKRHFERSLFERLTITNAALPMARATAEMGATYLLYCARNVDYYRAELRKKSNRIYERLHAGGIGRESLLGREVSMLGFGRIGRALVDFVRGFDVRWLVYDPYASRDLANQYPVRFAPLNSVLKKAELLVITAALTDETRGLLNQERLALMPDGGTVINIARGGIVDLKALTREVKGGRLRCALDVTDPDEPLPVSHPLRACPGAIVTPHIAAAQEQVRHAIAETVVDDLERFFRNEPVQNPLTVAMLDRMT
jgi:phosphoglycerate dehydrogenase-like enzyme